MRRDQDGGYPRAVRMWTRCLRWAFVGALATVVIQAAVWVWVLARLSLLQGIALMGAAVWSIAAVCLLGIVSTYRAYRLGRADEIGARRG